MDELDLAGMTWYGALAAVILLMISWVARKKRRFDTNGMTRSTIVNLVNETVLSARDRAVVLRRLVDGVRMEQLAEEFELSVPQVKRIIYRAEDALARRAGQK
jgi:DNA-directed RNA polymerase specialized sigma24 family protein